MVTSTLVFESGGSVQRHAGNYSDWSKRHRELATPDRPAEKRSPAAERHAEKSKAKPTKLSYKLQRELDALPDKIETLEAAVADMQSRINQADFYQQPHEEVDRALKALSEQESELESAIERWAELEAQVNAAAREKS